MTPGEEENEGCRIGSLNPILQAVLTLAQELTIGLAVTRHEDLGGRHGTRKLRVAGDVGEEPGPAHPSLIVTFVSRRRGGYDGHLRTQGSTCGEKGWEGGRQVSDRLLTL
jgi:hypothetical protein